MIFVVRPLLVSVAALLVVACVAPPAEPVPARPPPLSFAYRTPYVQRAALPPHFARPLASSSVELERPDELPPEPWIRRRLQQGDAEVQGRLLAALGRAAASGRLRPELAAYFDRLLSDEPSEPACVFLAASLERVTSRPARRWLWQALARCSDLRWAPYFARATAPAAAVVEWYAAGGRRDRTPTARFERAAIDQAQGGDWSAARRVGFALANLRGEAAWQMLAAVRRHISRVERRALLAVGFYDRPEQQALFLQACLALRERWEPLCDEERVWQPPRTLAEQVRSWDYPTPELVDTWQFDAVVAAAVACLDPAVEESGQVRCLERLAQLDWPRAVREAKGIRRGRLDYPYARELLAGLRRFPDAEALRLRLSQAGLPDKVVAPRRESSVSLRDFYIVHGCGLAFDTETGGFPNEHDDLAGRLAELVSPALAGVVFEELPPRDDEQSYRLRAYLDGRLFEVRGANYGDWYDVEAVLGLLNSLLRRLRSPWRLITLASGDQSTMVVAGDADRLAELAAEGLLLTDTAQSDVDRGQEAERELLERLRRGSTGGILQPEDEK